MFYDSTVHPRGLCVSMIAVRKHYKFIIAHYEHLHNTLKMWSSFTEKRKTSFFVITGGIL